MFLRLQGNTLLNNAVIIANAALLLVLLSMSNFSYSDTEPSSNEKAEIELLRIIDFMRNGNNEDALLSAEKIK